MAGAALTLCSCAATTPTTNPAATPPAGPSAASGQPQLSLPLDAYDVGVKERSLIQTARYLLIEECVKSYGIPFAPHNTKPTQYPQNAAYLGWLGAKQVSKYGYSGPPGQSIEEAAASSGIRGYVIPKQQEAVDVGTVKRYKGRPVPEGGCDGAAQRKLNGGALAPDGSGPAKLSEYKQLYVFMDDAAAAAYLDPRVATANEAWSRCMKGRGFAYAAPTEAESDPRWSGRGAEGQEWKPPPAAEVKVATADEACRIQTQYTAQRRQAYVDAQQKIISQQGIALERIKQLIQMRYKNAVAVLKERGRTVGS